MVISLTRSGINQNDAARYKIIKLEIEQANEQADEQANEQAEEQADEHIITKLNLYFNYIYNKGLTKFENISANDKVAIINIMKRLEIYFTPVNNTETWQYLSDEQLFDIKLQYWCVKEIYFSPYRTFLNELTRERFIFRFLKAKKYCSLDNPYEFLNYFIKCVQEDFYKNTKELEREQNGNC